MKPSKQRITAGMRRALQKVLKEISSTKLSKLLNVYAFSKNRPSLRHNDPRVFERKPRKIKAHQRR